MNISTPLAFAAAFVCIFALSASAEECCGGGLAAPVPETPVVVVETVVPANNPSATNPSGTSSQASQTFGRFQPNVGLSIGATVLLSILVNTRSASSSF